jgi:hypothetical protein
MHTNNEKEMDKKTAFTGKSVLGRSYCIVQDCACLIYRTVQSL